MSQLDFITLEPPNAATPLRLLDGHSLDQSDVYMRNNFAVPTDQLSLVTVELEDRAFSFTVADLSVHPRLTIDTVLECAGNGRTYMSPIPDGTPWNLGGASPVTWRGVRLLDVLGDIGDATTELVFTGADRGAVDPEGNIAYQFSLERKLWERAILATHLGEHPLNRAHGGPIRLVVPGHYAMKSVKWLVSVVAEKSPFEGHFVMKYRYFGDADEPEAAPVGDIRVRSLIARPPEGATLEQEMALVSGSAWSGGAPIEKVEVRVDDGPWLSADIDPGTNEYAAVSWHWEANLESGEHQVTARATDQTGRSQPLSPVWNRNGYANNLAHTVHFKIV